ncbi:FxSxx-COOH system tetratricopeptide repeat protein [Chondromyces crocatus]|uniref:ATP/GTP-binding protein n=1 Tax=Chondromyces crocatus TaxID=52 RepID=A0A0K1EGI0_CHOCO|nr:FxSxx-COOH system tetratricopeptide repeat protein [Chondromyces crocatus]AKT39975.1 ATP/GTP-binding protein [Chondromyces crocatus]
MLAPAKNPIDVFFTYAPRDEDLQPKLEIHLDALKRQGFIRSYKGWPLDALKERQEQATQSLHEARIVLLLVSSDFLHDGSWRLPELREALQRDGKGECRVIPVILRPCSWEKTSLGRLSALPARARAVTSYPNQSEAFAEIAKGIRIAVRDLSPAQKRPPGSSPDLGEAAPEIKKLPPRNPSFTGRDRLLSDLRAALTSGGPAALTQAISGLGGVGKTQLAAEYAHRYANQYDVVWWVRAEEPAMIAEEFAQLAAALGLPEKDEADQRLAVEAVRSWLSRHDRWLLVLDNVNDPKTLTPFLPHPRTGHVIITSRNPSWRGVATPLPVPTLERSESVKLLLDRTHQDDTPAAERLAEALGDLPLALVQAAATIEETQSTIATYYNAFGEHLRDLLGRGVPTDYPAPVATTWGLALQEAQRISPIAVDLLRLCAFLAPDDIPREGLARAGEHVPPQLAEAMADPFALDDAVAALRRYSFMEVHEGVISVHRLVQAVVRDRLPEEDLKIWADAAVTLVDHEFPEGSDKVENWPLCARWLPHALTAVVHAELHGVAREARARLLARFAVYLQVRAAFAEAKGYLDQALALHEAEYGSDDPRVASVLRNLGSVLHDLGDLGGARGCFERALRIDVATYGYDHPEVAHDVNDLGSVLMDLGDLPAARKYLERALSIDEATYGPDHPSVAIRLNNLGALFRDLGDFTSARAHLERALAIDVGAYGEDHPTVAHGRTNLGRLLHDLGDLQGARAQFEEALTIDEQTYGYYHPRFALALNNRGRVLRDLGDLAGARADFERALAIVEATYGPDHPDVARDINNLGSVLRDLGDLEGARGCFERVLKIAEATYGPDHPAVAIGCNNLGSVLQAIGDLEGARSELERALSIAQTTYGPDHPVVASIVNNLGRVLQALGDLPGAWQQIERAVTIATKALGPSHPSVQIFSRNLARISDALGSAP